MTSFSAYRRDFARRTSSDDDAFLEVEIVLPDLPTPSPAARAILAMFEGAVFGEDAFEGVFVEEALIGAGWPEIEILIGPGYRLH